MKKDKIILLGLVLVFVAVLPKYAQAQNTFDNPYFNHLLTDVGGYGPYVVVNVKANDYTGPVIVDNGELYFNFGSRIGMTDSNPNDRREYVRELKCIIENRDTMNLPINMLGEKQYEFHIVHHYPNIDTMAAKGKEEFIKTYFDDRHSFRYGAVNEDQMWAAIAKLFDWGILCKLEDESGLLYYLQTDRINKP